MTDEHRTPPSTIQHGPRISTRLEIALGVIVATVFVAVTCAFAVAGAV